MIKKLQEYAIYGIITIVMLVVMVLLFVFTDFKKGDLFGLILISTIIEIAGIKGLKWLNEQKYPTTFFVSIAIMFLMLIPVNFISWIFTGLRNDFFLGMIIFSIFGIFILISIALILTFIAFIQEKNKLGKSGQ